MSYEAVETIWLEKVIDVSSKDTPQGPLLMIGLANGRRYVIPLFGDIRKAVSAIASPITIASKMPVNGSGAGSPGQ